MNRFCLWLAMLLALPVACTAGISAADSGLNEEHRSRPFRLYNQPAQPAPEFALLHPPERPAYSDDWRQRSHRTVPANGHAWIILSLGDNRCAEIASSVAGVSYAVMLPVKLTRGSDANSRPGWFYETLLPRNRENCHLSPFLFVEWKPRQPGPVHFRLEDRLVEVSIRFRGHFVAPRRPFHIGLSNAHLIKGHCSEYCAMETELGDAYRQMLSEHHLTPFHHWIRIPPISNGRLDLDYGHHRGGSFRQQVMSVPGALIAFPRVSGHTTPVRYLRALQQTIVEERLTGRAWVYVRDEPTDLVALAEELSLYRTYAPDVLTMVTTRYRPSLDRLVDIFVPVINRLQQHRPQPEKQALKRFWVYASCMGSCGPDRRLRRPWADTGGADTGLADFLIDRPLWRLQDFFRQLNDLQADAGLYYHAVEGYPLGRMGIDLFTDPWNFGGNGDGLLLYPGTPGRFGLSDHQPLASLRLKLIRDAIERWWR